MYSKEHTPSLLKRLNSQRYAAHYLQRCFADSCEDNDWAAFGYALRLVLEAHGNRLSFSKRAGLSRNHLYRLFRKDANPTVKTLLPVLRELGLELSLTPQSEKRKRAGID